MPTSRLDELIFEYLSSPDNVDPSQTVSSVRMCELPQPVRALLNPPKPDDSSARRLLTGALRSLPALTRASERTAFLSYILLIARYMRWPSDNARDMLPSWARPLRDINEPHYA